MKKINRKNFLKSAAALSLTGAGAVTFLAGCGNEKKEPESESSEAEKGPCSDLSGLSDSEKETRDLYRYVVNSPHDDKYCSLCNYFTPPQENSKCGSCQIVKGPINPKGYCTSFVKKIS
jgi:hypothetical protein